MEVIKKRLQTYKIDIEAATERADVAERQMKEHRSRADHAEGEASALSRRIQLLEEDISRSEERLKVASKKLEESTQAADESERMRKALEHRALTDEEKLDALESSLKETRLLAEDSDRKYEETVRKLALVEDDLKRAEDRATKAEARLAENEEELKVTGSSLRTLELNEEKALQQQQAYEVTLSAGKQRLQEAESRAEFAERTVTKLQKEVIRLEDALTEERQKYKHISEELDQTFSELTAC